MEDLPSLSGFAPVLFLLVRFGPSQ